MAQENVTDVNFDDMTEEELLRALDPEQVEDTEGTPDADPPAVTEDEAPPVENTPETDSEGFVFDPTKYEGFTSEQLEVLKVRDKQIWDKERFIKRQAEEVGRVRKQTLELESREAELNRKLAELEQQSLNDANYDQYVIEKDQTQKEIAKLQEDKQELQINQYATEMETFIRDKYPDFDDLVADVLPEVVKKDFNGNKEAANKVINIFTSGEWKKEDPRIVQLILERAQKASMQKQIAALQTQVQSMQKSPDQVGKQISNAARQTRMVPKIPTNPVSIDKDPSEMSESELRAALGL